MDCHHHAYDPAIAERKQRNRDIFEETLCICRAGRYVAPSGTEVKLPDTGEVLKASVFYQNPPRVDSVAAAESSVCDAVNDDCIEVARKLVEDGYRPIMLNMANRRTPGGGVLNGARAQEESLFRQSNLCISLYQYDEYHMGLLGLPLGDGRYPMDRETGAIYSGRVTFFRTSSRQGDALVETPFECAVVSVAAINRAGIDTFTWDNVKVDPDGNLWFVDNGASFDFRACGKRKGWFWTRSDVDHPLNGYLSLANHPNQLSLRTILGLVNGDELWTAAKAFRFSQLVAQLPEAYRKPELVDYAKALEEPSTNS